MNYLEHFSIFCAAQKRNPALQHFFVNIVFSSVSFKSNVSIIGSTHNVMVWTIFLISKRRERLFLKNLISALSL